MVSQLSHSPGRQLTRECAAYAALRCARVTIHDPREEICEGCDKGANCPRAFDIHVPLSSVSARVIRSSSIVNISRIFINEK